MRTLILLVAAVLAGGCASTTPIGTAHYDALPKGTEVLVYDDESEVGAPFEPVAIIDYSNPGKYQILSLDDAIPTLKSRARAVGANGLIIEEHHATKSGIISTGISVRARAIRVGEVE